MLPKTEEPTPEEPAPEEPTPDEPVPEEPTPEEPTPDEPIPEEPTPEEPVPEEPDTDKTEPEVSDNVTTEEVDDAPAMPDVPIEGDEEPAYGCRIVMGGGAISIALLCLSAALVATKKKESDLED